MELLSFEGETSVSRLFPCLAEKPWEPEEGSGRLRLSGRTAVVAVLPRRVPGAVSLEPRSLESCYTLSPRRLRLCDAPYGVSFFKNKQTNKKKLKSLDVVSV